MTAEPDALAPQSLRRRDIEALNIQMAEAMGLAVGSFSRASAFSEHNWRVVALSYGLDDEAMEATPADEYDRRLTAAVKRNPDLLYAALLAEAGDDEAKKKSLFASILPNSLTRK